METARLSGIDRRIMVIDENIGKNIENFDVLGRGLLSQNILGQLRNFVEHIMLKIYADKENVEDIESTYDNIQNALSFVKTRGELKLFSRFHGFLQKSASHYTRSEENSERLILKYYEYLLKIKNFLKEKYDFEVLGNLDKFPLNTDVTLQEYYEKIAAAIDRYCVVVPRKERADTYYIRKIKPFFVNERIFYEVTFTPANDYASKFNRAIAFTSLEITDFYAVRLSLTDASIELFGKTMPVSIITGWEVSIRPCEMDHFSKILDVRLNVKRGGSEYRHLMRYLTKTGFSLVEVINFPEDCFRYFKQEIKSGTGSVSFFDVLEKCRDIIKTNKAGSNVLRYLLYHLTNKVIKDQNDGTIWNGRLSNLNLSYKCIPFDDMPFNSSLIGHNPEFKDLLECIDPTGREHELLARRIRNNSEINGQLYTPVDELADYFNNFNNVEVLKEKYNDAVYYKHAGRKLEIDKKHIYIREYEEHVLSILKSLKNLAKNGVSNYAASVVSWLKSSSYIIDDGAKESALKCMFEESRVALIYGSAGTGKSTLINHISHFFSGKSKLFLAHTNPAVDNLKRKVSADNSTFLTITKFLKKQNVKTEYDLLIIDECSTVSNKDMKEVLEKASFELLVLVGDVFQIESIRFSNWFSVARSFVPTALVPELTVPHRSKDSHLFGLWNKVRHMEEDILELITRQGYSTTLDDSIFAPAETDEIILCLNYDGLYGINNINRFLQESNPEPGVPWGIQQYKVNDPILFNESNRFAPVIYNNMKGKIVGIEILDKGKAFERIQFDIELDKGINELDASGQNFELLDDPENGNSVMRFCVNKYQSTDEDDEDSSESVVPFQVAYAVSIHKAQGLEYNSVKIVITHETDELITHSIFYTAITRARNKLKIYWTPEVENKILSSIKPKTNNKKDIALLKNKLERLR